MILVVGLLTLLVATSTGAQRIKGGGIIQDHGLIQDPHIHVGKGGGGGAIHHTEVVQDPLSGAPVVVEKVSQLGSGIKGGGLGAGSAQVLLSDGGFGRGLYRVGQSQIPFGLLGSDYFSYPQSLLTAPRALRRKTILSDNLSGLRPVGSGGIIVSDPSTAQFSVGDAQIKTNIFGGRPIYRSGISNIPYGLLGSDYYSYPNQLLTQRRLGGLGLGFTAGDSQIRGALVDSVGQEKVTVVETDPLSGGQRVTTIQQAPSPAIGLGGLRGGQILLSGGRGLGGGIRTIKSRPIVATAQAAPILVESSGLGTPIGGFGQRQVAITKSAPAPVQVVHAPAPVQVVQAPAPVRVVQAPAPVRVVQAPAPVRVVQAPAPVRVVQAPAPVRVVQAPAPVRVVQAPAPVRVVQAPAPVRVVQAPAPVRVVQAPAPVRVVQAPAPVRYVQAPAPVPVLPAPAPVQYVQAPAPIRYVQQPAPVRYVQQPAPVRYVQQPAPVRYVQQPAPVQVIQAPAPVRVVQQAPLQRRIIARPQVIPQRIAIANQGYGGLGNIQFTLGGNQLIGGPVVAHGGHIISSAPQIVAQAPRIVAPAPRIVAPAPRIVAPAARIVAPAPRIVAPAPQIVAPAPQILAPAAPVIVQAPRAVLSAPRQIITAPRAQVLSGVKGGFGRTIFGNRAPQLVYNDGGQRFLGIDIIGGSRIGDPRFGYTQLPFSTSRFANLGLNQAAIDAGPIGFRKGGSLLSTVGKTSPAKVVTQEEVIGPSGDSQIITTVTESQPSGIITGPSKIGGFATGGLAGIGGGSTKVVTQEEVIGPAGDSQIITTVTKSEPSGILSGPSKIGGLATGGLAAVGQVPTTIVQEQVNPITGLRTTSQISHVVQDPIETAIQETLGDGGLGQTQLSIDDGLGGGVTQVKETLVTEPLTGEVTKVTEVTKSGGSGLSQQNIADAIVQESISSGGIGGGRLGGYLPRVSFLSQYPYDTPDAGLLRSVITRPVVQQQQVEQILV